ncbi:hypothetical protein ZIOFF_046014 [Zingiber officinale]|uniref:Uncharacterized protein n=1 Tax=Zingiber officinale TaxID=94328 RepID=A0A8J5G092_ZINOF|nr:hypothetical protein ZIOFF_046014 [Zingiber officinale]
MGNSLGGKKKKIAKVMKVDGTTLRMKPPAHAVSVLRDHPGYTLLDADEVKRLGVRAPPLEPEAPLLPGRLYFLVELPRAPSHRTPRRAWSGALQVSAKERLESLRLTRRSLSDLSVPAGSGGQSPNISAAEETKDGGLRLKMRLPKAEVEKLMLESKDAADAARRIMQLCAARESAAPTPSSSVMSSPEPATPTLRTPRTPRTPRTENGSSICGGTSTGVFGQPSTPTFGASPTLAFGSSMPAFRASSTLAFSSASSSFGGSSLFGQKLAFGAFGSSPN